MLLIVGLRSHSTLRGATCTVDSGSNSCRGSGRYLPDVSLDGYAGWLVSCCVVQCLPKDMTHLLTEAEESTSFSGIYLVNHIMNSLQGS